MFSKLKWFLPAIRVHVWGGFGSQLFALIAVERLKNRYPKRAIKLIFHSSGVTMRKAEMPQKWLEQVSSIHIDDFVEQAVQKSKLVDKSFFSNVQKLALISLKYIGVVNNLNFESEFKELSPWFLTSRGHYSHISLSINDLLFIRDLLLDGSYSPDGLIEGLSIHLRLGDLLELDSKSRIESPRINSILEGMKRSSPLYILSDSPTEIVQEETKDIPKFTYTTIMNLGPIQTINFCWSQNVFIGTNSKLSIWIALLRLLRNGDPVSTYLPRELFDQFSILAQNLPNFSEVEYY